MPAAIKAFHGNYINVSSSPITIYTVPTGRVAKIIVSHVVSAYSGNSSYGLFFGSNSGYGPYINTYTKPFLTWNGTVYDIPLDNLTYYLPAGESVYLPNGQVSYSFAVIEEIAS